MKKIQHRDLIIAFILLIAAFCSPSVWILDQAMVKTIFLIVFSIFLWIRKPVPIGVTSLFVVILMPLLELTESINEAFAGFSTPSNYFVIASFGVAIAIRKTTIPSRILKRLLAVSNGDFKIIILAYMIMTYSISTIMSDITAVMISITFAIDLLERIPDEKKRKLLGRGLLISLPLASIIGGSVTPAGSTVNVMALNILSANTGIEVPFLKWCMLGFPISLILLFITWFLIIKLYTAENMSVSDLQRFLEEVNGAKTGLKTERAVIGVIVFMVIAWIAGTWIKPLNTTTVAVIGLLLMFLPGINAFTWKEFVEGVHWEIFFMGGAAISLGKLVQKTGLADLLAECCRNYFTSITSFELIGIIGLLVTLVLMVIPVGPATVSTLTMPIYAMAAALEINPVMAVIAVGIFASNSSILPLNSVMLLSYAKGYWKTFEMTRIGLLMSVCWIVLAALWMPVVSGWIL